MPGFGIHFNFLIPVHSLRNRSALKRFLKNILTSRGHKKARILYIFCSDAYLLQINRKFLKHNSLTDIISFNLADPGEVIEGEIYVSIDRVRENARLFHTSLKKELHRVIFHGLFHLCGYEDKSPGEKLQMRALEDKALSSYFK